MLLRMCFRAVLAGVLIVMAASLVMAQEPVDFSEQLTKAREAYYDAKFESSLAMTDDLLHVVGINKRDSIAVLELQSFIFYAMGEEYKEKSRACLQQIAALGPCLIKMPREFWPRDVANTWCNIAYKNNALNCQAGAHDTGEPTEIKTIAVWPFDNNSVTEYKEELGDAVGIMLAEIFQQDLGQISSLNVVERIKLQYLINELKLAESGRVDNETVLKAGRLLNAHVMVFGSFSQLNSRDAMMQVRAVNVETSEIITSVSVQDRPKLFQMEQDLVQQLCKQLDIELSSEEVKEIKAGGSEKEDATDAYARGLEFEEKHEYKKAYESFKLAYELDPDFEDARIRRDTYKPLAM